MLGNGAFQRSSMRPGSKMMKILAAKLSALRDMNTARRQLPSTAIHLHPPCLLSTSFDPIVNNYD